MCTKPGLTPIVRLPLALCKSRCEFPCQFTEGISRTPTIAPTRWPPPSPPQSTYVAPLHFSSPSARHRPHAVTRSTLAIISLPIEVQIVIASHLIVTLEQPMDDLRSLWATCSSMHHIYSDLAIGWCLALDWFRRGCTWDDPVNYKALLASQTQVGNLEACFLIGIQTVFMEKHSPDHALTISPTPLMTGTIWWPIWSPYCSIGTIAMPATMTLRGGR
jgi:hypothetical protein